jgi:iron complex transport system ATP-binding protein
VSAFFALRGLRVRYGGCPALDLTELDLAPGGLVCIAGPNGAGKSTLLGALAGLRPGYEGQCVLEGREVRDWPRRELARAVSFVPQSVNVPFPFTAAQVVYMGRTPYCDGLFESAADHTAVERALALTDASAFRERDFRTLSGGERQRVILASALAQSPRALLLDEPATFLDLRHQVSLYRLLKQLAAEGLLVAAVTHDLNLALAYADRVVLLGRGSLLASGPPAAVLDPPRVREVFGVDASAWRERDGRSWLRYAP